MRERVVITGTGCVSSFGVGAEAFVDGLLAGQSGIAPVTGFSTDGCRSRTAALLGGFDPGRYIEPLKLRRMDQVGRLAVVSCRLAIDDARLPVGNDQVGVVMGTATAGLHSTIAHLDSLTQAGPSAVPAFGFSNTVGNAAASLCGIEFKLRGPNITFAEKQVSALAAIAYAAGALEQGRISACLTGGFDDFEEVFFRVHDRLRVLARDRGHGEVSRPFDVRRNGFVLGAGAYVVVLETARSAEARGAEVLGELLGLAAGASPCELNGWPKDGHAVARVMRAAIGQAGLAPGEIDAVFGSANSSRDLDRSEALGIEEVFGPCGVPVVSIKGATGECGASGAASLVAALHCLHRGLLPPTLGCTEPDPECRVDVRATARAVGGRVALVNGTAAGGAHYTLAVKALAPCAAGL